MTISADQTAHGESPTYDQGVLREIASRVLWLSAAIVDAANAGRANHSGVKVGGHQASSASMVDIMTALKESIKQAQRKPMVKATGKAKQEEAEEEAEEEARPKKTRKRKAS